MSKNITKNLYASMQKVKKQCRAKLATLEIKKLLLLNVPYLLIFLFADRAACLYRDSRGIDMGTKLLLSLIHI